MYMQTQPLGKLATARGALYTSPEILDRSLMVHYVYEPTCPDARAEALILISLWFAFEFRVASLTERTMEGFSFAKFLLDNEISTF